MTYDDDDRAADAVDRNPAREVYSVSQLNEAARDLLEGQFPLIWVEGEISNLARPASGHLYFTLKDAQAQVRCAMFKLRNRLLGFQPDNGRQVLVRARVSLYTARGDFQLIAEHMEAAGDGALRRRFELLKQQLGAEGLFDANHKRPLPALPARLGVITSPSGAALRDILSVLRRRFPAIPILIYPVPVQGAEAPGAIVEALHTAGRRRECDLLILARGGGSLEDLWAFNDEAVARAIYASPIPVVTGIGHETDFTIADFVADARAPTPSAAAELVSPDRAEWAQALSQQQRRLQRAWQARLAQARQTLTALARHLKHPGQRLRDKAQRLDELEQRLRQARAARMHLHRHQLKALHARLLAGAPDRRLREGRLRLGALQHAARRAITTNLQRERQRLGGLARALDTVSPLATLGRGYAIVQTADGRVLRAATEVAVGARVQARLGHGRLACRVEGIEES
jgi:exodeoxyribonuclease VII large subunit